MKANVLPEDIIKMIREEGEAISFGTICLEIHLRDGKFPDLDHLLTIQSKKSVTLIAQELRGDLLGGNAQ